MAMNPLAQRQARIAFAIPLILLALGLTNPPAPHSLLPGDILFLIGFPLGLASIGFGVANLTWHLTEKGVLNASLSNTRQQTLPLRMALIAGIWPLLAGAIIMSYWLYRHSSSMVAMGVLNILAGVVSFGFGMGCLVWHLATPGMQAPRMFGKAIPAWGVALLLISNFPAAYACVAFSGID